MKHAPVILVLLLLAPLVFAQGGGETTDYTDPGRLGELISGRDQPGATAYILVDVRSAEEYEAGHLPTALNIPHTEIGANPPTEDKDALVIVYCRSGARSTAAKKTLDGMGYRNVVNFGAVSRWPGELVKNEEP